MTGSLAARRRGGRTSRIFNKTGVADCKKGPGNLSVEILRRAEDESCHFWTVIKWDSFESLENWRGAITKKPDMTRKTGNTCWDSSQL